MLLCLENVMVGLKRTICQKQLETIFGTQGSVNQVSDTSNSLRETRQQFLFSLWLQRKDNSHIICHTVQDQDQRDPHHMLNIMSKGAWITLISSVSKHAVCDILLDYILTISGAIQDIWFAICLGKTVFINKLHLQTKSTQK